jgi:C4-type Zn-finger protein
VRYSGASSSGVAASGATTSGATPAAETREDAAAEDKETKKEATGWFSKLSAAVNSHDPHTTVMEDKDVNSMHERAEVFEERTEDIFKYLQVRRHEFLFPN